MHRKYSDKYCINHKFLLGIILTPLLLTASPESADARYASIVIDYETGKVLHALNPDTRNYPASLTKMMTLYLTFEAIEAGRLSMSRKLTISANAEAARPSKLGLRRGGEISVRDAILAIITKSANDAAVVIAEAVAGSEKGFSLRMTRRARALGMKRTNFRNASGLPNRRQLSTARDIATLARRLMRDFPGQYHLFATKEFAYDGRTFKNHNALIDDYPGADGLKTGYTRASGYNLAASAKRANRRIIGVIFGERSVDKRNWQMRHLLDRGFAKLHPATAPGGIAETSQDPKRIVSEGKIIKATTTSTLRKPAKTLRAPAAKPHEWAIQVGTFREHGSAQTAADKAAMQLSSARHDAQPVVIRANRNNAWIYRARLVGLTRNIADAACRKLIRRRVNCKTVAPRPAAAPSPSPATQ